MACCPNGVFYPQIRDCEGNLRSLEHGEFLRVGNQLFPATILSEDVTIYVDPNGSDFTGNGSIEKPYKTIGRAAEHYLLLIPGNFEVTVHLNPGIHTVSSRFQVSYPFGASLVFEGETETLAAPTVDNIDAAADTDANYPQLRFYDFELDVTGTAAEAGMFVVITNATGGTNPQVLNGLHRIESVASDTAVCRVWQCAGANAVLPSGAITVSDVKLLKSVLKFTANSQGVWLNGISAMGQWDNLVIEGNVDAYTSERAGVEMVGGAFIRSALGLYMHEWGRGVQPFANGATYLQAGAISKCRSIGINCPAFGIVRADAFVINGTGSFSINAVNAGQVLTANTKCHSMNNTAVIADNKGYIDISGGQLHYPAVTAGGFGLFARDLSDIDAEGATVTGFGTVKSPATNPGNDESRIIGP